MTTKKSSVEIHALCMDAQGINLHTHFLPSMHIYSSCVHIGTRIFTNFFCCHILSSELKFKSSQRSKNSLMSYSTFGNLLLFQAQTITLAIRGSKNSIFFGIFVDTHKKQRNVLQYSLDMGISLRFQFPP